VQSVSEQHCAHALPQSIVPDGQSQLFALLVNDVLQLKSQWPSVVQIDVAFCGAVQAVVPQPSVQPALGVFAWSCSHVVPHWWNPPTQLEQPAPV
jgi:hypothetical protein